MPVAMVSIFVLPPIPILLSVKVVGGRYLCFRDQRGGRNGTYPNEIAARALETGKWISLGRHLNSSFAARLIHRGRRLLLLILFPTNLISDRAYLRYEP